MPKILSSVMNNIGYTMSFRTNNKLINILRPKLPLPIEEKTGIYKPVSYTHLDVYKRQHTHITAGLCWDSRDTSRTFRIT